MIVELTAEAKEHILKSKMEAVTVDMSTCRS